jgi:1-acyl-sn-glycerol-3-phosphate acyltransferase
LIRPSGNRSLSEKQRLNPGKSTRRSLLLVRSGLFDVILVLWTSLFAPPIPVLWLLGSPETAVRSTTRFWARGVLLGLRHVVGLKYVEEGRRPELVHPHLIISNHQSMWETLAFLVIFPDVSIVAKHELLQIPVFGWYLKHSPMIIIDRDSGANALRKMIEHSMRMAATRSVLVFPEGSRRPATEPVAFRRGVELLYAKLGLPVQPVAVNSGLYWSSLQRCRFPGTITVSHLRPIEPGLNSSDFIEEVEANIKKEARRLVEQPAVPPEVEA